MRRLEMKLASMCGRADVDQLLSEISTGQFSEWVAYWSLEPESSDRICYYLMQLTAYVYSIGGGKKNLNIDDFRINFGLPRQVDPQAVAVKVKAWMSAVRSMGGVFKKKPFKVNKRTGKMEK